MSWIGKNIKMSRKREFFTGAFKGPCMRGKPRGCEGFSLVELLVASLIIMIIFISWLRIANFQAVRKESLRRLAIEKAAGYLDVMAERRENIGVYRIVFTNNSYAVLAPVPGNAYVQPLFKNIVGSPGYVLKVMPTSAITNILPHGGWPPAGRWAIIRLYDAYEVLESEAGRAFSTMSIFVD
jgi:type II secretory pathway pseudopilin PulG